MRSNIIVDLAQFAAYTAGDYIKKELSNFKNISYKSSNTDLVTNVDKTAEKIIRKLILNNFPNHSIMGEEEVLPCNETSVLALEKNNESLWIRDPIDGTTNYNHGFPYFCIYIAYVERKEIKLGVIYNPIFNEMFIAEKNKGTTLNGKKINVNKEDRKLENSLVSTKIPESNLDFKLLLEIRSKVRDVRSPGAAALQLAYVASGRLSAFWEKGLNVWDIAAGALILNEAGGVISDMNGAPYELETRNVLASNGSIQNEILSIIERANKRT